MDQQTVAHPAIVTPAEWRARRVELLDAEKELTRQKDRVNALRRRLPMERITKDYTFDGPAGKVSLRDLFGDKRQLIVYHFMFDPAWDKGCTGCTGLVNAMGDLSMLPERGTNFVLISRAPLAKLDAYKTTMGWDWPWYSSQGSDFNYDYHVTLDDSVVPYEYNYKSREDKVKEKGSADKLFKGESHGTSVFFRLGDDLFHTYSCYARGCESLTDAYALLDLTPYGRQEDFEDSPEGWPQKPTYG